MRLLKIFGLLVYSAYCASGNNIKNEVNDQVSGMRDDSIVVNVRQGLLKGLEEKTPTGKIFYSFKSIPFAKPPIGKLRFKDPVPAEPWEGIFNATKDLEYCFQYPLAELTKPDKSTAVPAGSEDCLYLSVSTAKPGDTTANLPVMVSIHGGGFFYGGGQTTPPHVLMEEDIVLVVIQYRLNVLGFLSTEDSALPGNMGIKDQQLALKWIQDNIRNFGGDPGKVTLFGNSAGAVSSHMHMLSPGSKGLFHGVILQSGTALCPWAFVTNHRTYAKEMGDEFNCSLSDGTESYIDCMQDVPAEMLLEYMSSSLLWLFNQMYTLPRVDGDVIPDQPEVLIKEKRYNKVNMISGITRDEGALLFSVVSQNSQLLQSLNENFTTIAPVTMQLLHEDDPAGLARQIYQHYLGRSDVTITPNDAQNIIKLNSDRYNGGCHDVASLLHANDEDISVYQYQLDYKGSLSMMDFFLGPGVSQWVGHTDELIYLFSGGPEFFRPLGEEDLKMRERMVSLWTNFAKFGNPTPQGYDVQWEKATPSSFRHLSLQPQPFMVDDNRIQSRKFWSSLNTKQMKNILPHPSFESSANEELTSTAFPQSSTDIIFGISTEELANQTQKSVTPIPETVNETSESVTHTPNSVTQTPETGTQTPDSVTQTPETGTQTPDSVTQTPDSGTQTPKPLTQIPELVTQTPKPVTQIPELVTQTPESVFLTPDLVTQTPTSRETKGKKFLKKILEIFKKIINFKLALLKRVLDKMKNTNSLPVLDRSF